MFQKRRLGVALLVLGLVVMALAALLSSAATASAGPVEPSAPPTPLGLGWLLGLVGVGLSFAGVVLAANARGAFF